MLIIVHKRMERKKGRKEKRAMHVYAEEILWISLVRKFISKTSKNYTDIKLLAQEYLQYKCNFWLQVSLSSG